MDGFISYKAFCMNNKLKISDGKSVLLYKEYRDNEFDKKMRELGFNMDLAKTYYFKSYDQASDDRRVRTAVFVKIKENYLIEHYGYEQKYHNDLEKINKLIEWRFK